MKILMEEAFFFLSRSALFSFHSSFTPESCQVFSFSLKQLVFSNLPAGVTDTVELVCMYVLCFISSCQYFLLQQMLEKKSPTCRLNETKDGNCTLKIRFAPHFKASHKAQYPIPSCFDVCDFICFHGLHLHCWADDYTSPYSYPTEILLEPDQLPHLNKITDASQLSKTELWQNCYDHH